MGHYQNVCSSAPHSQAALQYQTVEKVLQLYSLHACGGSRLGPMRSLVYQAAVSEELYSMLMFLTIKGSSEYVRVRVRVSES